MVVHVDEDILAKSGPELFREVLRVYPVAELEDYHKGGMWKDDLMRTDIVLIYAHAREAGAPYPPPLKDVKLPPNVPKAGGFQPAPRPSLPTPGVVTAGIRPVMAATVVKPPLAAGTLAPAAAGMAPVAAAAAGAGQATELRLIALFITKWKLDPTKTKMILAKLTPPRRRHVIQNFKSMPGTTDPTAALEQFLAKCEQTNSWGLAVAAPVAANPKAVAPQTVAGIKRPLTPTVMADPSKRPRMVTPGVTAPGTIRPMATGIVRPPITPRAVRPPGMMRPMAGRF